jgi:hypothetical protein
MENCKYDRNEGILAETNGRDTSGNHIFQSILMFQLKSWAILLITISEVMIASITIK